ncbi:MAG: hypothetical protein BalsKO_00300 [Balneolaceae bacterium]
MLKKIALLILIVILNYNSGYSFQTNSYTLEVGQVFLNTTTITTSTSVSVNGQLMDTEQKMISVEEYEVLEAKDGHFILSGKNISSKLEVSSGMGSQSLSSEGDSPADFTLKILKGKTYTFTMNEFGQITKITGLSEVRDSLASQVKGTPLEANLSQLTVPFEEENMMSTLENKFWIYPETNSETWNQSRSTSMNNMPANLDATYTRLSANELSVLSDLTIKGDAVQMGMPMKMDLTGTSKGTYDLDPNTGIVKRVVGSAKVSGTVNTQGMSLPITVFSDTNSIIEKK